MDNLAKKVNVFSLSGGIVCIQLGLQKLSIIRSTRVSAIQGLLKN